MNQREQAIATIREALDNAHGWDSETDKSIARAAEALSALSEPGGEAPVEAKALTADRIMEVVDAWAENDRWLSVESPDDFSLDTSALRSRLSELGLK